MTCNHIVKEPTNPEYIGPGSWVLLHRKSYLCITIEDNKKMLSFFYDVVNNFGCKKCRKNSQEYISKNDPEKYVTEKIFSEKGEFFYLGMFYYIWKFHNEVNKRSSKKEISLEEAIFLHSDQENCNEVCTKA